MNSTVIQEIANQLGMAVDDAGTFIHQCLPQYASLQIFYNVMWMIAFVVLIVITVIVARKIFIHQQHDMDGEFCTTIIICSATLVAVFMIPLVCSIGNAIGWIVFPEASLIDMVFDCAG